MLDERLDERLDVRPMNSRLESFEEGELFIYKNGNHYELGKVKRVNNTGSGYFCWYHTGDTAASTNVEDMHKIVNAYVIESENFGKNK